MTYLIFPHQRKKRVQPEVYDLSDAVMKLYSLDLSGVLWGECREGTVARLGGKAAPEMLVRIPSARLECTALLLHIGEDGTWDFRLSWKGTVEDAFPHQPGTTPATPAQHTARLARRFPKADREALLASLTRDLPAEEILEAFLGVLAPWACALFTSGQLAPAGPAPDPSSPNCNAPDQSEGQRPPEPEPTIETCLPFLTGVRGLRRSWSFPRSLLYLLFPGRRPRPEDIPHQGWTGRELEAALARFQDGELDHLELNFALQGEETFVRRMNKRVRQGYTASLELIRERGRCVCLFLDDEDAGMYRLIADRDTYMSVDSVDLGQTPFLGQQVVEYTVFPQPSPEAILREAAFLLARIDRKDGVLSPTKRMGVWSREGTYSNTAADKERQRERRQIWCL